MILLWEIDTPVEPRLLSLMQTAADCALWAEGVRLPCVVNVRLCGDEDIREINREYRQTDRATDVLSFPTVNYPKGVTAGRAERLIRRELDDELDACMLGDLILSIPHVLAQAEEALLPEELAEADDYGDYAYADEYSTIFDWRTLGLKSLSKHE